MDLNLTGRTALVCGASQGIGRATALALAEQGARVLALARTESALQSLLQEMPGTGHKAIIADLTKRNQLITRIAKEASQTPIEILINNTGGPKGGPIQAASEEEFVAAFAQHLLACSRLAQVVLPGMKSRGYGRIVNVISTSVKVPIAGLGVSNTIRAAVASWAKTLSLEVGMHGITVNNVLPGYTKTPRLTSLLKSTAEKMRTKVGMVETLWRASIPLGRFAEASEVANAIAFLASPAANYISGVSLPVDGGRTGAL